VSMLRVLLVDDEALSRLRLRTLLADCVDPACVVVGEAASAPAALHWLTLHRADVVLLDIHMPGMDGLQLAERLRGLPGAPAVIFVTAHSEHALAAFEVEAVDYLLRVAQRLQGFAATAPAPLEALSATPVIVVHERGEVLRVPLAEVLYLKAEQKYVTLRTARRALLLDEPLAELEERLGERFLRIHRNALVARHAVVALERRDGDDAAEGWVVRIAPTDEWLAVSRRQLVAVRDMLVAEGL
jgi:two-component system, LytTR family, response regulator AlgR